MGEAPTPEASAVELAYSNRGSGPPLVILHGLYGSSTNWRTIANHFENSHEVYLPDLRNHGRSPWTPSMSFSEMASDLVQLLEQNASEAPIVIGHSLGGKVAMVLALNSPQWVERLIVVDIAPTTYPPKTHPHLIKAMMDLDLEQLEGRRAQADQALKPSISDPALRQFLLQNLVLKQGRFDWRINLQTINREIGILHGFPVFPDLIQFTKPSLFISGERSNHLTPRHYPSLMALFPEATLKQIARSGHWVHAEQPEEFIKVVDNFISAPEDGGCDQPSA